MCTIVCGKVRLVPSETAQSLEFNVIFHERDLLISSRRCVPAGRWDMVCFFSEVSDQSADSARSALNGASDAGRDASSLAP